MENTKNTNSNIAREEEIDLRFLLLLALNNWSILLIFGLLGMGTGYLVSRYTQPDYEVSASIFVPEKTTGIGKGLEELFANQLSAGKNDVYNQIEILKSFNINNQTAQKLGWRTSWFRKKEISMHNLITGENLFNWKAYYKEAPFDVVEKEGATNASNCLIYVKPTSAKEYLITIDGLASTPNGRKQIKFSGNGEFGKLFESEDFHFTINQHFKEGEEFDTDYSFIFSESGEIARNYLARLQVNLNDKQSSIIRLKLEGTQPQRAIDYLNTLIEVFVQQKMSYQTETQKRSLVFIDKQLISISDTLKSASSNFSQFRANNEVINIGEQGTQVMTKMIEIESEKNKNQMQLDYFRNLLVYLGKSDGIKQLVAPSVVGIQDVSLNSMVVSLSELYSRRQILSFSTKENNPALVMMDKEITQTTARLKENLRNLIENAQVLSNSMEKQLVTIKSQLKLLPKKEQELINFQRRYDLTNDIYTFLLQKRAEIDIALAGATPEVQIIDVARYDTIRAVGLSAMYKLLIGLLAGLALPGIILLVYNFFSNTIKTQDDIERNTRIPTLGNVIHSITKSDTAVFDYPRSGIAESYRSIRTNLQFLLTGEHNKIVAIHSTNPGEGKSFTTINLSTILAMNNKKVVMVGADMRKPRLQKIFGQLSEHGLSTYLSGQDKLEQVVFPTTIENLSIIPAGPIPPNPAELIDKPEMTTLLSLLREKYDYVIIDNAPTSLVTDGLLVGRHADLNVFILRYGVSKIDQIKHINHLSDNNIIGNITLIINDIKGSGFGYGKNYYYYNYKYSNYNQGYYEEAEKPTGFKSIFPWKS